MLWARLLAYATETVDQELLLRKRISGGGEPDPERSDQGSVTAFGRRKGDAGRDRSPAASNAAGGRGGHGQARYDSPESPTAKTKSAKASIRTSNLTFLDTAFGHDW